MLFQSKWESETLLNQTIVEKVIDDRNKWKRRIRLLLDAIIGSDLSWVVFDPENVGRRTPLAAGVVYFIAYALLPIM